MTEEVVDCNVETMPLDWLGEEVESLSSSESIVQSNSEDDSSMSLNAE